MSGSFVLMAVASGFPMFGLRSRPVLPLVGREVSIPYLPSSDLVDQRDGLPVNQAAADHLLSVNLPPDPEQEHDVGVGTQAPVGGVL